jgi:hypothetical protein
MKKVILKTIFGAALVLSIHSSSSAQIRVNINIGSQPEWGPTGYNHVDYYYLPDIESYYDVANSQYIYLDNGGRWIHSRTLPPRFLGYDLYSGYKVVVNHPKPYLNFAKDRVTYAKYRNWRGTRQPMLRESRNNGNHYGNNGNINRPGNNGNHFGNVNRPGNGNNNYNNGGRGQINNRPNNYGREHGHDNGHY